MLTVLGDVDPVPPSSLAPGGGGQVFITTSENGGLTWGPVRAGPMVPTSLGPAGPPLPIIDSAGRLVLLTGHRLWTSADYGATSAARVAVLPEGLAPIGSIDATPDALFISALPAAGPTTGGSEAAIRLRSRDGGIHWEPVPLPPAAHA